MQHRYGSTGEGSHGGEASEAEAEAETEADDGFEEGLLSGEGRPLQALEEELADLLRKHTPALIESFGDLDDDAVPPWMVDGWVIVLAMRDLSGYTMTKSLHEFGQHSALTRGLLEIATDMQQRSIETDD